MYTTTEPPDPLSDRDLLVAETSPDVVRAVVEQLLARGMSAAAILAEVPTVPEQVVRDASARPS